jgi:hypothetical protein
LISPTVKYNPSTLYGLMENIKAKENRLLEVEKSLTGSNKEISKSKPRVFATESEASSLKSQISILVNDNVRLVTGLSAVSKSLSE